MKIWYCDKAQGGKTLIKMVIKMDENRIKEQGQYSVDHVYSVIDRIFEKKGMQRIATDKGIEYLGHENPTDFSCFGQITLGLKDQSWFMDNATTWLLCSNDDVDNPADFSEEDLLKHYCCVVGEQLIIAE